MKIRTLIISVLFFLGINASLAQVAGCTDPQAANYNPTATINDGSCTYNPVSVTPLESFNLAGNLSETSGLIAWNNQIWTHNDNDDLNIYALDSSNGTLLQSYLLSGATNTDWEEISQDDDFVYVGDFGNNQNGNRTDLKIWRIDKNSILAGSPIIESINFSYSNQQDYSPAGSNHTDFDCEAFIVSADSIYLFTKQWISQKTSVYALSKTPGTSIAKLKSTFDVKGLITGATYIESKKFIALCGYSTSLQPFIYLLYDFNKTDFFSGNKRKIEVTLAFHQVEGIASFNGSKYYISNEQFIQAPLINSPQMLHTLDMSQFTESYLNNIPLSLREAQNSSNKVLYPNPAKDFINLKAGGFHKPVSYQIINQTGQIFLAGKLQPENLSINISDLQPGLYLLRIGENKMQSYKLIKR